MVFTFGSWGFAYHERLKEPPRSFAELVDGTIKGKWRVALPNAGYTGTPQVLIWALADALGGSVDNVDPAFDAIKKMKPNISFFASITDPLTLLESGEADLSLYPDGRTWAAYDSGAKWIRFLNPKEGGVNLPAIVQKVKNGSDLAWEYINSMLAPGPQSEVVKRLNYETSNPKAVLPPEIRARITPWQQCRFAPAERWPRPRPAGSSVGTRRSTPEPGDPGGCRAGGRGRRMASGAARPRCSCSRSSWRRWRATRCEPLSAGPGRPRRTRRATHRLLARPVLSRRARPDPAAEPRHGVICRPDRLSRRLLHGAARRSAGRGC